MPTLAFSGLVDYVSHKDKPAMDRALTLAEEIAANGAFILLSRMMMISILSGHQSTSRLTISQIGYFPSHGALFGTRCVIPTDSTFIMPENFS
jgi:hypothetical protein